MAGKNNQQLLLFLAVLLFFAIPVFSAENQTGDGWEWFGRWYDWKKTTDLTEEQRAVIDYFNGTEGIEGKKEYSKNLNNHAPEKAVAILKETLDSQNKISVPKVCIKFHQALLSRLELELKYQEARKAGAGEDDLQKITFEILAIDGGTFSSFFEALREVGLFDKMEAEMIKLGLIDEEEVRKEYDFYKEYRKGGRIISPKCGHSMKRVRILYESDKDYTDALKNREKKFLFGTERFEGCPEYGYKCDKCNIWYEEYPGRDKNTIIIRNWCWGWHELVYKKKTSR